MIAITNNESLIEMDEGKTIVGTGYVALDIISSNHSNEIDNIQLGGTVGNVLTIMAYLGWKSYPIIRLGEDQAFSQIRKDLIKWGVNTNYVFTNTKIHTPIVIERLQNGEKGFNRSRYEWICPNCGERFPKYNSIKVDELDLNTLPRSSVFFFDRLSKDIIKIAKIQKEQGALIVFEPNNLRKETLLKETLCLTDIVKYSKAQIKSIPSKYLDYIKLEIQTIGSSGVRFRYRGKGNNEWEWAEMKSINSFPIVDTTGAGDWCTAGFLNSLIASRHYEHDEISVRQIEESIQYGQALASLSCGFIGARGIMDFLSAKKLESIVNSLINGNSVSNYIKLKNEEKSEVLFSDICPVCSRKN